MAKQFDIPSFYRSPIVGAIKQARRASDQRKRDLSASLLDLGPVRFRIARHFGFCFGVENAIEIAYRALAENPGRRVFLLSEMIHNAQVNGDLRARGVQFLMDTSGTALIPLDRLQPEDIVIVPAFGTTVELLHALAERGIDPLRYNATCPFVERVWKRARQLGEQGYAIVVHGKHTHEETRATFSHAQQYAPTMVLRDIEEATCVAEFICGKLSEEELRTRFEGRWSEGFDPARHLTRIGVVNQTTMLASETHRIALLLREALAARFGEAQLNEHFADTRDTLCYATNENQDAVHALLKEPADLALVVGGYNSSNTSHLVELCEARLPTYYICDAQEILSGEEIRHLRLHPHGGLTQIGSSGQGELVTSHGWLPAHRPVEILLTAGASCPDALVDRVLTRVASLFPDARPLEEVVASFHAVSATA